MYVYGYGLRFIVNAIGIDSQIQATEKIFDSVGISVYKKDQSGPYSKRDIVKPQIFFGVNGWPGAI